MSLQHINDQRQPTKQRQPSESLPGLKVNQTLGTLYATDLLNDYSIVGTPMAKLKRIFEG